MANILDQILSEAKSQDLEDGIHENCRILEVDVQMRQDKDGNNLKRNTYIKIGKFDEKGKRKIAEKEIAWFNIDPTSEYVMDNFREQIIQLVGILKVYYPEEEIYSKFDIFEGIATLENGLSEDTELEVKDIEKALKSKKSATTLLTNAIRHFYQMMQGKYGYESQVIRVKLTFSKDGKYIQQPTYGNFVESAKVPAEESNLKMSKTESKYIVSARDYSKVGAGIKASDLSNL